MLLKRQMRQFGGQRAPDLLVAQGPATERVHELLSNNSHSSASFGISPMQQQTQQQQPQGISATVVAPQLHPLFGGESGQVYVPPGPVKEPSLVQNSQITIPLEQSHPFEDLDMIQDCGDAFTVAPQGTQGTLTNYLGSGTANSYPLPITSNLTPHLGVESSPSVQLSPIQQPYPQNELGAATGASPGASFTEPQWTNNPNLCQPEYSLVSSAPGQNSNFQLQSQSSINGLLGYNPDLESQSQLSPSLGYNPNLQLQSQSCNGLEYNPNLESQTQSSTGLGYSPNLQPQSQSSSGLGYNNLNFQPSQSSNGLGYNPITLESSQSQLSICLGQNHNLQQQSQSSNGLGYPNLEPQSQLSAGLWHNSNLQPESQTSNLEPQSQISNCLGHNPNLDSQFQSSNGQGYSPNFQPQAQIFNFLGYNSNVQPQAQSTNGPEYNPNLQPQSQLSTGFLYCDSNVQQSSTGMGVSQEIIQSPGLNGSYQAGWPSNYQNQSPNIEQQGLLVMQPTPKLQPHEMVPSSSNVVITTTLQDRNNQQSAPFHMGTSCFRRQAAQGFENLQPRAPRRLVRSQIYDSSFEEMGLPIDPHLRFFNRRNL